jgi:hypothetical protein
MSFSGKVMGITGASSGIGSSAAGGFGLPGTQDGGAIGLFGAMPRGEWHSLELELDLGTTGQADGAGRLFIDGERLAEREDVELRPLTTALIDQIWIGGWYSNLGVDPDPSPAVRDVDDVVACAEGIGS